MRRLAEAGLTTREACGNSVRNITACPYAGVGADEAFDVTPYAEAMTRYLLRHPLSSSLPRKFKIAFEGCADDHALTAINDIGWRARVRDVDGTAERGFRVTVGGGTSTLTRVGRLLFEFLPAGEMLERCRGVVRVFHRLGDYQHKQRNRMKFLIRSLGWERWRAEFERRARRGARRGRRAPAVRSRRAAGGRRARLGASGAAAASSEIAAPRGAAAAAWPRHRARACGPRCRSPDGEFARWRATNVRPQKQEGTRVDRHRAARRLHRRADARARGSCRWPTATAPCA